MRYAGPSHLCHCSGLVGLRLLRLHTRAPAAGVAQWSASLPGTMAALKACRLLVELTLTTPGMVCMGGKRCC